MSKRKCENANKKTRNVVTLEKKIKIIEMVENGGKFTAVGRDFKLSESTVRTIMKQKDKIKKASESVTPITAKKTSRTRSFLMTEMENLLCNWIEDLNQNHMPVCTQIIMNKALSLFNHLKSQHGVEEVFKASKGWFDRFKKRSNLHSLKMFGESASADVEAAEKYPLEFREIVERGNYTPDLIFNVDETGLYWKRMPTRTFISIEEKSAAGFKAAKDRLTLLLGGNASGELKLKPLLIYQSETPRAMKGYSKNQLPVFWRSNHKAWMTQTLFIDWFKTCFCPAIKKYCVDRGIEPRALLVLDNAPGHPLELGSLCTDFPVEVVFLPPNTTSILQPMDQGSIAAFKAYYLRKTIRQLIEQTDGGDREAMRVWWKQFNIMKAIRNIDEAWNEVSQSCMKGVWKRLFREICEDPINYENDIQSTIEETRLLAISGGIDGVDEDDIRTLLESNGEPLTNEELQDMVSNAAQENDVSEPVVVRKLSIKVIEKALSLHNQSMELLEENDENYERVCAVKRGCHELFSSYRQILHNKRREAKQGNLDSYLLRGPK